MLALISRFFCFSWMSIPPLIPRRARYAQCAFVAAIVPLTAPGATRLAFLVVQLLVPFLQNRPSRVLGRELHSPGWLNKWVSPINFSLASGFASCFNHTFTSAKYQRRCMQQQCFSVCGFGALPLCGSCILLVCRNDLTRLLSQVPW